MPGTGTYRRIRLGSALGILVALNALVALVPAGGAGAAAGTASAPVVLPLSSFGGVVVDGLHQHVFISSPSDNTVLAADYSGNVVARFTGLAGAGRMALDGSSLFVLDSNAGAIERIDTAALTDKGTLASGLVKPNDLAVAGGRLWTTTNGCSQWSTQLVAVDESTGAESPYPAPTTMLGYCAAFATSRGNPTLLVAWDAGIEPANLTSLNVGGKGAPAVVLDQRENSLQNLTDVAVSDDGQTIFPASGAPYEIDPYSTASLGPTGLAFPTGSYPDAVATTGFQGGLLAAGIDDSYSPLVGVFSSTNPAVETSFNFGQIWPRGLAFSPDGSHLFAVSGAPWTAAPTVQLNVVTFGPTLGAVTVTAPSPTLAYGSPIPASFTPTYNGLPAGTSPATPAMCTTTATSASPVGMYPVTCSGAADPNYWFSYIGGTLQIGPAPVTVRGPSVSLSFGAPVPGSFPPAYSGLANATPPTTPATCATAARTGSTPGTYPITCSGAADPDYTFTYTAGSLTITKASTTLVAASLTSTGSRPTATLTRTLDGAPVAGATIIFTVGKKMCSAVTTASGTASCKTAGSVSSFTASFAGDANYLGSNATGSLS